MTKLRDLPERFTNKIAYCPTSGCWLWAGTFNGYGYGVFYIKGRRVGAHRFAYETCVGPIPTGLEIDHLCRVRCCVNPAHLEAVTKVENALRSPHKRDKPYCPMGHAMTPENTKIRKHPYKDGRLCRICENARYRRIYWEKKNAKFV